MLNSFSTVAAPETKMFGPKPPSTKPYRNEFKIGPFGLW